MAAPAAQAEPQPAASAATGQPEARGGKATGGTGGDGGFSSFGIGGGIHNANNASLVINPRLHAKKGSSQSKATDLITSNQALLATGGAPGTGGSATAGTGGSPNGANGTATHGANGAAHPLSIGAGGGIFTVATATIDFTIDHRKLRLKPGQRRGWHDFAVRSLGGVRIDAFFLMDRPADSIYNVG